MAVSMRVVPLIDGHQPEHRDLVRNERLQIFTVVRQAHRAQRKHRKTGALDVDSEPNLPSP